MHSNTLSNFNIYLYYDYTNRAYHQSGRMVAYLYIFTYAYGTLRCRVLCSTYRCHKHERIFTHLFTWLINNLFNQFAYQFTWLLYHQLAYLSIVYINLFLIYWPICLLICLLICLYICHIFNAMDGICQWL